MLTRLIACLVLVFATAAAGEDAFFRVRLAQLKLTEGVLPDDKGQPPKNWQLANAVKPYAVLDGSGEAYVTAPESQNGWGGQPWENNRGILLVRADAGQSIAPMTGPKVKRPLSSSRRKPSRYISMLRRC